MIKVAAANWNELAGDWLANLWDCEQHQMIRRSIPCGQSQSHQATNMPLLSGWAKGYDRQRSFGLSGQWESYGDLLPHIHVGVLAALIKDNSHLTRPLRSNCIEDIGSGYLQQNDLAATSPEDSGCGPFNGCRRLEGDGGWVHPSGQFSYGQQIPSGFLGHCITWTCFLTAINASMMVSTTTMTRALSVALSGKVVPSQVHKSPASILKNVLPLINWFDVSAGMQKMWLLTINFQVQQRGMVVAKRTCITPY